MDFSISEHCAYPTRDFRPAAYLRWRRFEPPLTLLTAQLTIKPRGVALTIISVKISIKVVRTTRREVRWAKGSSWLTAVYWFVIFWIWNWPDFTSNGISFLICCWVHYVVIRRSWVAILSWPQRFESQGLYTRSRKVGDNKMPEGWLDGLFNSYSMVLGWN